jgi:hypothetical protein
MDSVEQIIAKQAISELSCRYMRGLDRLDRELLMDVFWDDAYCEYGFINGDPKVFIDFALGSLAEHKANHHMIGNTLIEFSDGQAYGEVYFNAYHKVPSGDGWDDVIIAGRYLDRYEERNGEWKFIYRSERVDFSHTRATNNPYMEMAPDSLFGSRQDDAVYDLAARHKSA